MRQCEQEMCAMWDGDGCPCDTFGLDRDDLPSDGTFTVENPTYLSAHQQRRDEMGYPHFTTECDEHWRHVTNNNIIDAAHLGRQREWSAATFGPGDRLNGVLDHIRKELDEIREAPGDASEWADGIILLFDGAWRNGIGAQEILDAIVAKQAKNEGRTWPDWRTAEPGKAIEHVRT